MKCISSDDDTIVRKECLITRRSSSSNSINTSRRSYRDETSFGVTSLRKSVHLSPASPYFRHLSLRRSVILLILSVICLPHSTLVQCSHDQRPFYNIAHMVNSIKEVNYYLSRGANAIEADVSFSPNGTALYTFHGYPCDCFRHCTEMENLVKYLEYIREITSPGKVLLFLFPFSVLRMAAAGQLFHRNIFLSLFCRHTTLTHSLPAFYFALCYPGKSWSHRLYNRICLQPVAQ